MCKSVELTASYRTKNIDTFVANGKGSTSITLTILSRQDKTKGIERTDRAKKKVCANRLSGPRGSMLGVSDFRTTRRRMNGVVFSLKVDVVLVSSVKSQSIDSRTVWHW